MHDIYKTRENQYLVLQFNSSMKKWFFLKYLITFYNYSITPFTFYIFYLLFSLSIFALVSYVPIGN